MLIQKKRRQVYSESFKRQMVSEYEAGGISYQELANKYNFNSSNLQRWRSELSVAKAPKKALSYINSFGNIFINPHSYR